MKKIVACTGLVAFSIAVVAYWVVTYGWMVGLLGLGSALCGAAALMWCIHTMVVE